MSRKILLADDSVTIQKVVELTFMDEDVEVTTFGDGAEALERLDEVAPDLVVADVHMPGADGYEVCRQVKSRRPGIPVLLLVGTFEPFDEGEADAAGAEAFLKKPFDSQDLLQKVDELLASATPHAAAPALPPTTASVDPGAETVDTRPRAVTPLEAEPAPAPAAPSPISSAPIPEPQAPAPAPTAPAAAAAPASNGGSNGSGALDDATIDRIAQRVAELIGDSVLREVAWEVVPDLAEVVIKERIRELESQVE